MMEASRGQQPTMTTSCILLLAVFAFFYAISPSIAGENNLILSGEVLGTDAQISYGTATFDMQADCNLVLYNNAQGFQTNTHGKGTNCTLTLNKHGQLIISDYNGYDIWTSPLHLGSQRGNYAAILRPDGEVAIYGSSVWSSASTFHITNVAKGSYTAGKGKSKLAMVRNILFSDQIIYKSAKLRSRDYTLVMREDCNLALEKASSVLDIWVSGTYGKGQNCFASLSHRGELVVNDYRGNTLWSSNTGYNKVGEYALVLQIDGQAVIYGRILWSTASSHY